MVKTEGKEVDARRNIKKKGLSICKIVSLKNDKDWMESRFVNKIE